MTFSIVAFDPKTKDLGVAVESKFPAVGNAVPFAEAGVGAVATQSYANTTYGPRGLALLRRRIGPTNAIVELTSNDKERAKRQVGIVDARGRAASYTGYECNPWAGHIVGRGYACQGNILAGEGVVTGMARAFESTVGDLPVKLLAALVAGQDAGGDRRGQQSAALLVVRTAGGYGGFNDRWIDLRVDDHSRPIDELLRIFNLYDMTMLTREDPKNVVPITPEVTRFVQRFLKGAGHYTGAVHGRWDAKTQEALEGWMGVENLENKVRTDGVMWASVWRYLREKAGAQ
ncbi:MAG: DUF1028 domain-containing protein [Methanobacteriota archaeon]|nr:MAG: DUF1028 domain-containing protein [Euryarchaeota archaeon]